VREPANREPPKEGGVPVINLVGCNNGIEGFHKNLVTFRGPKLPDFYLAGFLFFPFSLFVCFSLNDAPQKCTS